MRYSDIRLKIKSGDLLAWTHKSWGSWNDWQIQFVRFFTQSEYSHVGLAYVIGSRIFVLEAVGSGVRMVPLSANIPFFLIQTGMRWNDRVEDLAVSKLGEKYSKWAAIKSFFIKIKPGEDRDWECAEYAMFIMQEAGFPIDCHCTPTDVIQWMQENLDAPLYAITKD